MLVLVTYLVAVVVSFIFFPAFLTILGIPWSFAFVMLGWMIIHAGSGNALEWSLAISTIPNLFLLLRWILNGYVEESIAVD